MPVISASQKCVGIVGATGVLGRYVIPRLLERGHRVQALVRSKEDANRLSRCGVDVKPGDILEPNTLIPVVKDCDVVLHLATAIPKPGGASDWSQNDRIRREGTANLIDACHAVGVKDYLQQSIALLQAGYGEQWIDEDTPAQPNPITQSAADMEAMVQESNLKWCILRGGAFYGPGTAYDQGWRELARGNQLHLPREGNDYISLIHVTDMANAVVHAVESPMSEEAVLCITDNEPVTYANLFEHIVAIENAPPPKKGGASILPSFRVSNSRIQKTLGWYPHYATYRSGLV